jgi:hypothetical protein
VRKVALSHACFFLELAALLAFVVFFGACQQRRTPDCFVFSRGFVGWVSIQYNVAEAAPLPVKDGCLWIDFRTEHLVKTSSKLLSGWAKDRYIEDTGKELAEVREEKSEGRAVQDHFNFYASSVPNLKSKSSFEYLFVGTADQLKRSPRPSAVQLR